MSTFASGDQVLIPAGAAQEPIPRFQVGDHVLYTHSGLANQTYSAVVLHCLGHLESGSPDCRTTTDDEVNAVYQVEVDTNNGNHVIITALGRDLQPEVAGCIIRDEDD